MRWRAEHPITKAIYHGATEDKVREIANIVVIPAGFPRAIQASQVISELIAARKG